MREAKFVATVFGTVTACLFGGLAVAFTTAPNVSSKDNIEIAESASDEHLTIAATETSVSTTTERIKTTSVTTTLTTTAVVTTTMQEAATEIFVPGESLTFEGITLQGVQLNAKEPVTENNIVTTQPVTTTTAAPVTTTTTTNQTTTTTTTTAAPVVTTITTTAAPTEAPDVPANGNYDGLPISESDFIILCNAVGNEAGSNWISEYDKACVVEVIMNRVNDPRFPNTILGVLTQPYQFTGASSYVYLGTYSRHVTESVKNAVRLYFNDPSQFSQGFLYFHGDGYRNYFS